MMPHVPGKPRIMPHVPVLPIETRQAGVDEWVIASGPTFGLVDVRVMWPIGAASDGERAGLTSLAWEMMEHGTRSRDRVDFHAALERLGATLSFRAYRQSAQLALRVLEPFLEAALDLVAEALLEPADDAEEFAELLEENEEAIEVSLESPEGAVGRWISPACWKEMPWSLPADGTAATRSLITLDDLAEQRSGLLSAPAIWGVSAEDPGRVEGILEAFRLRVRGGVAGTALAIPKMPARQWGGVHLIDFEANQGAITIVSDGPSATGATWPATVLHSSAFGDGFTSPLVNGLRARDGLSYEVGWSLHPEMEGSVHVFRCNPEGARVQEAFKVADTIWREAAETRLTEAQLDRAKASFVGARLVGLETADARLASGCMLRRLGLPVSRLWELPAAVLEATADDVAEAAAHYAWGTGRRIVVAALPGGSANWKDDGSGAPPLAANLDEVR